MTSVPNPQQLLSGSKLTTLCLFVFLCLFTQTNAHEYSNEVTQVSSKKVYQIAILLPFHCDLTNSVIDKKRKNVMLSYYQGMKIALKQIDSFNVAYNILVLDTDNDTSKLRLILARPALKNMDLIIGPTSDDQVHMAAEFCKEHQIPLFLPFTNYTTTVAFNPFVFNLNSTHDLQANTMVNYYKKHHGNRKFMIIRDGGSYDKNFGNAIVAVCKQQNIPIREIKYSTTIPWGSFINSPSFIVHTSLDKIKINYSVTGLQAFQEKVVLVGSDRLMDFTDVDHKQWENLHIVFVTTHKSQVVHPISNKMRQSYRENYRDDPSSYSYMGYDHLLFAAEILNAFGSYFPLFITNKQITYSDTDFTFKKTNSCYHNQYTGIYRLIEGEFIAENIN